MKKHISIFCAPERSRLPVSPLPAPEPGLRPAQYRLGVKGFDSGFVETLLFLSSEGMEIGYYTIHFDLTGSFVDFSCYDEEKEVRAVYERFSVCDSGTSTLVESLEQDLLRMGYFIPGLRAELSDMRLTCGSSARCSCAACVTDCPLQERYCPERP